MKKYLVLIAMVASFFTAKAQDSSYDNSHYRQRLEFFKQMPDQRKEIVFLGNSITEAGEWQELLLGRQVVNRGISGDVTYGVRARLEEVLSSQPAKIFLLIGINDMKRGIPVTVIAESYGRIVEDIVRRSPKTKLYLQSILPVNEGMLPAIYKEINNDKIKALNELIKAIAVKHRLQYIDLHKVFEGSNGQMARELSTDGLHIRSAAYIKWVAYLKALHVL